VKSLVQRTDVRSFVVAVLLMGLLRFALTIAGFPDSFVKFFSMSVILLAGTVSPQKRTRIG
jgi:hypothetical protein